MKTKTNHKKTTLSQKADLTIRILLPLAYLIFYVLTFRYLETRTVDEFHVIEMEIDSYIPFCEYFIIPYMLWFAYITVTVILFIFGSKKDYYRLIFVLGIGMTVFLLVSYLIPNMQPLRPASFERDNIFVDVVKGLYAADTCTNVFPSIHVFNSLAANFAIQKADRFRSHRILLAGSHILSLSIVLSTVFLKQHSMFDVLTGIAMAAVLCWLFYYLPETKAVAVWSKSDFLKDLLH